jgi:surface protein
MDSMFYQAVSFDQNLGNWNVSSVTNMAGMLTHSGLSSANYDNLLTGWNGLPELQSGITFDAGTIQYSAAGSGARSNIISTYGWTINDGGAN